MKVRWSALGAFAIVCGCSRATPGASATSATTAPPTASSPPTAPATVPLALAADAAAAPELTTKRFALGDVLIDIDDVPANAEIENGVLSIPRGSSFKVVAANKVPPVTSNLDALRVWETTADLMTFETRHFLEPVEKLPSGQVRLVIQYSATPHGHGSWSVTRIWTRIKGSGSWLQCESPTTYASTCAAVRATLKKH